MNRPSVAIAIFCLLFAGPSSAQKTQSPWPILTPSAASDPLPGTQRLSLVGDLSRQLVDANDAFLDRRITAVAEARAKKWILGNHDPDERRAELGQILGMDRDERIASPEFEYFSTQKPRPSVVPTGGLTIYKVRWRALDGIFGEGLLLEPRGGEHPVLSDVIAIPDADQTPEEVAQTVYAQQLVDSGCRVLIPALVSRKVNEYKMTNREWLHRPAFELGRHLLGYELAQILAGLDAMLSDARPSGVIGWGEGGLLALYAGALDTRIDAVATSGYFGPREGLWRELAEHNVFGLLETFGDAEVASLVAPRSLTIESGIYPKVAFRPGDSDGLELLNERPPTNGKPGQFPRPSADDVLAEFLRIESITESTWTARHIVSDQAIAPETLVAFTAGLGIANVNPTRPPTDFQKKSPSTEGDDFNTARQTRLITQIERFNQRTLIAASKDRSKFFSKLQTNSLPAFEQSIQPYRDLFRTEVIGDFEIPLTEPNPRSRPFQEGPKTISYEVVLDVHDGVFAYGILTLPKDLDLTSGEKRPVVVCQHGLEGRPQDTIGESKYKAYKAYATRLAERGFITFAPQNGYKYFDHFRMQQFKAQSIGKTLFSIIVPQHLQITEWLAAQPFVDGEKIAFYGLSYGGKSAMRIPPLVDRYCLSICSGDFNDWIWKNAATDPESLRYSYANKGEYEMYEWNLGGRFNYAEMATLICPRPFMVERGHFDGVAPDGRVGLEFAKVRNLYQARLGIGDRCEIEWFPGPHSIHGQGSFQFLHRHLSWPMDGAVSP